MDIVWFILIGIAAGWLAGRITSGRAFGLVGDLIVGVIGAFIGGFLLSVLKITSAGLIGSLAMATLGAVLLLLVIRQFYRRPV